MGSFMVSVVEYAFRLIWYAQTQTHSTHMLKITHELAEKDKHTQRKHNDHYYMSWLLVWVRAVLMLAFKSLFVCVCVCGIYQSP